MKRMRSKKKEEAKLLQDRAALVRAALQQNKMIKKDICEATGLSMLQLKNLFQKDRNDIQTWVETVVVINESEYVWQFIEENIMVLVAPVQRSIDEVVEAYLFRELHDLNV